jgi:hypothetical protein
MVEADRCDGGHPPFNKGVVIFCFLYLTIPLLLYLPLAGHAGEGKKMELAR